MKNRIIVIFIFLLSFSIFVRAQDTQILDKDMFDIALDSLIEIKFYEDSCKDIRVSLALKIDSIGEVHSAHILQSENLSHEYYNTICIQIELYFNLKFLYDRFRGRRLFKRYVWVTYPYMSKDKRKR